MITAIDWRLNLEFLFRLALAGACGATIGYERLNRLKSAGLRTHFIVAIASALMMIVSKYAYFDVVSEAVKLDPSRVAAGIVSGVSFLGAGMIFRRNQSTVTGLTTAAGIWGTAGCGMAIGGGLYVMGIAGTVAIFLVQAFIHRDSPILKNAVSAECFHIVMRDEPGAMTELRSRLRMYNVEIMNIKAKKEGNGNVSMDLQIRLPLHFDAGDLMNMMEEFPAIQAVEY